MWRITESLDIDQPPEIVFDYLRHFQTVQEWDSTVISARMTSGGEPTVGSRFSLVLLFGWTRVPMTYEITSMTPHRQLVLKGSGGTFEAIDRIDFERIPGGTRLTYQADITFERPFPFPVDGVMRVLSGLSAGRAVKRLKTLLAGAATPPRLTVATRMADQAIFPGLLGFTRVGVRLARRRRPVASRLYAGRTMVLTGGTSGIGKAAARALFAKGVRLVVVGRSQDKLARLRREFQAVGGGQNLFTEIADLSLTGDIRALAERLNRRFARIDVLINNAGALFNRYQLTAEGHEKTLATDLLGPYLLTRMLLPSLAAAPAARVINVASGGMYTQGIDVSALQSDPETHDGPAAYARAKRGLVILTELWAREWAPVGIGVHAMHPGWVDTPGLEKALPAFHQQVSRWLRSPAEGADTIVWLAASPDAARSPGRFWLDRKIRSTHVLPGTRETAEDRLALVAALDELAGLASTQ
jgi:dehydrogenase/reductase SDR family protein 12